MTSVMSGATSSLGSADRISLTCTCAQAQSSPADGNTEFDGTLMYGEGRLATSCPSVNSSGASTSSVIHGRSLSPAWSGTAGVYRQGKSASVKSTAARELPSKLVIQLPGSVRITALGSIPMTSPGP